MTANEPPARDAEAPRHRGDSEARLWLSRVVRLLLVVVILGAGVTVAVYWMLNRPTAQRQHREPQAVLVEVRRTTPQTHRVAVRGMGTVVPSRSINLPSQVGGRVVEVSPGFVPGGSFKAGQRILQIEPIDYELAVEQRKAELVKAESDFKVELGQQSVAQREYELLGREVREEDRELVLRKPQLAMAQAAVASAQAALRQAELDLARTSVAAPFNAMIQSRGVDLGSEVSTGAALASLVGTDTYWVRVLIPVDELGWISVPGFNAQTGSDVRVYHESAWGAEVFRQGKVERLMTELEPQGRMAMLLVAVADPLELSRPVAERRPLILDSYVHVAIEGRSLADVVRVERTALRDGEKVWVMTPDGTLAIRRVEVAWSGDEYVLVREGLSEGDLLVTSDIGAPVEGMALRASDGTATTPEGASVPATPSAPQAEERP